MDAFPSQAQLANLKLIEELYEKYLADPESVEGSWRHFFEGIDFAGFLNRMPEEASPSNRICRVSHLIDAYRHYGHLKVPINPIATQKRTAPELDLERLGFAESELTEKFPTLGLCGKKEAPLQEIIDQLNKIYCSRIGFEYMDLGHPDLERWIQSQIEPELVIQPTIEEKHLILEHLNRSELLESFIHVKYPARKRFSLEGNETLIPLLAEMIEHGSDIGMDELLLAMAHRGRLNTLANFFQKPYADIFREFEETPLKGWETVTGDKSYHLGIETEYTTVSGKKMLLQMAANPSHLESVNPVVLGQTRAEQVKKNDEERKRIGAIIIHGDAALAGQGIVYEIMQFYRLSGYSTGGTIHIALNNQIGYTTLPDEGRSTRYCTDIAKTFGAPVFHVNAEDPESCIYAAKLAIEIRHKFQCDVFIDLNGYRKYGHNEGDEPAYTQPLEYKIIRAKKSIQEQYIDELEKRGHLERKMAEEMKKQFKETLEKALREAKEVNEAAGDEEGVKQDSPFTPVNTGVDPSLLKAIMEKYARIPENLHIHEKLRKAVQDRLALVEADSSKAVVDWGTAECLAFGSLLWEGIHVRLAGQDTQRGTFAHRHAVWIDQETGRHYIAYDHLKEGQGKFDVINSPLSEYASLGFEYGYSWNYPEGLILWEAQFGDFANGAEITIDQYLCSGEEKWQRPSSLVLLLPHGYEGMGSEHSSARIERFLQLSAHDNMRVINPTLPAQFFHALRRQVLHKDKKPLIVFTPKSLLRSSVCTSALNEFQGHFEEILDDPKPPAKAGRLLITSGKIYFELAEKKAEDTAIIRIEQYYPLHFEKLKAIVEKYKGAKKSAWVQEEPENMGAWEYLQPFLRKLLPEIRFIGRERSAVPAAGSSRRNKGEQEKILKEAFS